MEWLIDMNILPVANYNTECIQYLVTCDKYQQLLAIRYYKYPKTHIVKIC
jgi:hypothetical protein